MAALREIFAEFGIEFDRRRNLERGNRSVDKTTKGLSKMGKTTSKLTKKLRGFAVALGVAAPAVALVIQSLVDSTVESTQELIRWAERLGITTREMNAWRRVGQRFGADMDDITDGLKELQLKARDAMTGTQSYIDAFALVGIRVSDLAPIINDQTALMDLFTTALNNNTNAATQNFVADELMSDAGTRLLPMFRRGTEEIQRLRAEADKLSRRQLPALEKRTREYIAAQREWGFVLETTRNELVIKILPVLTRLLRWAADAARWFQEMTEHTRLFEIALVTLIAGTVALLAATVAVWGPYAVLVGAAVVATLALVLALEDIWIGMQGGKSITEEWLSELVEGGNLGTRTMDRLSGALKTIKDTIRQINISLMQTIAFWGGLLGIGVNIDTAQFGEMQATRLRQGQELRQGAINAAGGLSGFFGNAFRRQTLGSVAGEFTAGQRPAALQRTAERFDPRTVLRTLSPGAPTMAGRGSRGAINQRINAPSNTVVNVTEAQDPAATANRVQGQIDASWQRQLRQVTAASTQNVIGAGVGG